MATEEKEKSMTLKFTVGKAGLALGKAHENEDYVDLKDGQVWKKLKYVTDGIVGTWRWGNLVETVFQDELAFGEFWAHTDQRASGDGEDPDIDDDLHRVEEVDVTTKVWKDVK